MCRKLQDIALSEGFYIAGSAASFGMFAIFPKARNCKRAFFPPKQYRSEGILFHDHGATSALLTPPS